ncbi:hypothetical protein C8J57DRAFT_1600637 [Mycena rebaudengoi]|nr:hypothetical protein C8J57DRAFT_1600637 [Mycena rebaudengoi]
MSAYTAQSKILHIAGVLAQEEVTAAEFVLTLLERSSLQDNPCTTSLLDNATPIIDAFSKNSTSSASTFAWARKTIQKKTSESIKLLTQNDDWHFGNLHASAADLEDFKIEEMAKAMKSLAPDLWNLLYILLSGETDADGDHIMEDATLDGESDAEFDESGEFAKSMPDIGKKERRRETIRTIKIAVMISIMMQSRNQKCNALESVFGIFLHSTNTPEKVIQALAHMGISISPSAITTAIHSLSAETAYTLREMGQTLLVGYAYDNFDINFPTIVPTIEKAADPLTHLTSGALICLEHGIVLEDLACSEELWTRSKLNPTLEQQPVESHDLTKLYPEADHPSGLTRRERFNAAKFKSDLFEHGPDGFRPQLKMMEPPESVEQIPVVQMRYAPARAMDINQSTHTGNISAIGNLLGQGGVGPGLPPEDPNETDPVKIAQRKRLRGLVSILNYVVLFFGDLGTFERVQGVLLRRSIEATPWLRHQFIVFVMGFFHLKMAAADAIWRIFIDPKEARVDDTSLMAYVAQIRPRETGKIGSNPGFRRMHEVIRHVGIILRLDAWRVEAKRRNPLWKSLKDFVDSKPTSAQINEMAEYLAENYVSGGTVDIYAVRSRPTFVRDKQNENTKIMHQYFLLYEELSFAMNQGDIGRLETTFLPWSSIFRAVGKHKYSTHMIKYLTDVHFVYPPRLGHAAPDMTTTFANMAPIVEARGANETIPGRESAYSIPDMLDRGEHILYNVAERSDTVPDDTVDQVIEEDDLQAEHT